MYIYFPKESANETAWLSIVVKNSHTDQQIDQLPGRLDIDYDRFADGVSSVDISQLRSHTLGSVVSLVGTLDAVAVAVTFLEPTVPVTVEINVYVSGNSDAVATEGVDFDGSSGSFSQNIWLRYKWL